VTTSFMLSNLATRYRAADATAFKDAFPHPWVVWEPGPWAPPGTGGSQTLVVTSLTPGGRSGGEALAMALKLATGRPTLVLGRAENADLPINDATLSRNHLTFSPGLFGGWALTDQGSSNGSWLNGKKLSAQQVESLKDGAQIQAGQVYLTFYEPSGLYARLRTMLR
jgi:hypothetical protein